MMNDIAVSVVCITYNHEKYIRKCLDSFLMQKTNFKYEVIIHDDASTDGTQEIIKEYEKKYPDIIKPIYQKVNQLSQGINFHKEFTVPKVRGKYVALCEGDDYWTDDNKLQIQFECLENNSECSMCVAKTQGVYDDETNIVGCIYPRRDNIPTIVDLEYFLKIRHEYPFHTTSHFCRSEFWKELYNNPPEFKQIAKVPDEPLLLYMLTKGNIYYIDRMMSCYRRLSKGSYGAKTINNRNKVIEASKLNYLMIKCFSEYINNEYECYINKAKFNYDFCAGNYKELLKKEMKDEFNNQTLKRKMFIIICYLFPAFDKLLTRKIKNR